MQKTLGAGGVTREVLVTASASWTLRFKHNQNLIPRPDSFSAFLRRPWSEKHFLAALPALSGLRAVAVCNKMKDKIPKRENENHEARKIRAKPGNCKSNSDLLMHHLQVAALKEQNSSDLTGEDPAAHGEPLFLDVCTELKSWKS